jgi:HK97 family phage portal protein
MSVTKAILGVAREVINAAIVKAIPTVQRTTDNEFLLGGRLERVFGIPPQSLIEEQTYVSTPWPYAAINAIARNIQTVPFVFEKEGGRAAKNHAFVDLFERPNRWQGFGQFMESIVSWLHLEGEVFIVLRRKNENEVPKEMTPDNPTNWEEVVDDDTKRLVGWFRVMEDGSKVPFRFHEVIHIKFWNPLNEFRGLAPMSAARSAIIQDRLTNEFNTTFFANSGSPAGVIEMDENLTEKQFERLARQYDDRHGGAGNAHKMLLLEGGAKFKQTTFSQKDMEFLNQKKWNRDEILAVYGVPKMEVGIIEEGANLAVIKMQSQEFWQKNLIPKMDLIVWAFWAQLFSRINGGRVWAEFDTSGIQALHANYHENVQTGHRLMEMGYPVNQVNRRLNLGMEENSWQNFGYKPVNIEPLAVDENGTPIPADVTNPDAEHFRPPATGSSNGSNEGKPVAQPQATTPPTVRPAVAQTGRSLIQPMQSFFFNQRCRQLKDFESGVTNLLEVDSEIAKLMEATENALEPIVCDQIITEVHRQLLSIVTLHLGDEEKIVKETKKLYNQLSKAVPEMVLELKDKTVVVA